jgi:4-amino-4-deoxy-L-arabinose transferase-like glycosyltransferase
LENVFSGATDLQTSMFISSRRGLTTERIADGVAMFVLLVISIIAVVTFRDYGLGWDDYTHAQYGDLLLKLYGSGFTDRRALSFVNLYAYGGGFDMLSALVAKISGVNLFDTRRLVGATVGIIGLVVTWRLGRRVGGPIAGLIALVLLATCPLYYGHMFMNAKDAPFAVAMTVLLLGAVRIFEGYPAPSAAAGALFGIGLGLAIGTRVLGGLTLFPFLIALSLLIVNDTQTSNLRQALRRASKFVIALLPALIIAYAVMALIWPWSVVSPLNPLRAAAYFSNFFEKPWKEMFDGALVSVPDMPRTYVPQLFMLEMPEILLVLGLGGIAGALIAAPRRDLPIERRSILLFLAAAVIVPIAMTVVLKPAMYNGIRHFVFVTPALAVLGGLAGKWMLDRAAGQQPLFAAAIASAITASFILPVKEMARLHPYQYTYFNWLAGGIQENDDLYMLDYWGLAFKQAAEELRTKLANARDFPPGKHWRIAVCGPERPAEVELGPEFVTTWNPTAADFAMVLGEFYCAELNAPILVEIEREGVVFARVYDIRGRTISSLLTIPPP